MFWTSFILLHPIAIIINKEKNTVIKEKFKLQLNICQYTTGQFPNFLKPPGMRITVLLYYFQSDQYELDEPLQNFIFHDILKFLPCFQTLLTPSPCFIPFIKSLKKSGHVLGIGKVKLFIATP